MTNEDKYLLLQGAAEIRELRRQNDILRAKVEMIDLFALVLTTKPNLPSSGATIDVAWMLDKRAEALAAEEKEAASAPAAIAPIAKRGRPITPA